MIKAGFDPKGKGNLLVKKGMGLCEFEVIKGLVHNLKKVPLVDPSILVQKDELDLLKVFMTSRNLKNFGTKVLYELVSHDKWKLCTSVFESLDQEDWM